MGPARGAPPGALRAGSAKRADTRGNCKPVRCKRDSGAEGGLSTLRGPFWGLAGAGRAFRRRVWKMEKADAARPSGAARLLETSWVATSWVEARWVENKWLETSWAETSWVEASQVESS